MQDLRIIRETAQLLVAPLIFRYIAFRSRALHSQNWPDSLRKTNLSETPALDFTACRLRFPRVAMELAVMPFRSSAGDSEKLAPRWRDVPGNEVTRRKIEAAPLTGLA